MVKVDDFAKAVYKALEEYQEEVTDKVKAEVRVVAKEAVKELKLKSPKDAGDYAKSWKQSKRRESANSLRLVVHNKDHYRLTHLLERGHAKRNGGWVEAKPHIAPVEEKVIKQLLDKTKVVLQK